MKNRSEALARQARGIALIAVIIIITVMSLGILGVVRFVFEGTKLSIMRLDNVLALYAAQAGVNAAIRDYEANGRLGAKKSSDGQLAGGLFYGYSYGRSCNYLLVESSQCQFIGRQRLNYIALTNISEANTITITAMKVYWQAAQGSRLVAIDLGGQPRWRGVGNSGDTLTLNPALTIPAGVSFRQESDNQWFFDKDVKAGPITFVFVFGDNTQRTACVVDENYLSGNNEFVITATGKVGGGAGIRKRTIEVTYDVGDQIYGKTPKVTSWQESSQHIQN